MYHDFSMRTAGFAVFATVKGSYGEEMWVRVGRAFKTPEDALIARDRIKAKYPDAHVVDPSNRLIA
jgi:hypothetical protein